jgi:hypothetical protein
MKIGIISDTHGSVECWRMAFEKFFSETDLIFHAGDVLYHGPRNRMADSYSPPKLVEAIAQCPVPIIASRGNCDSEVDAAVLSIPLASPYAFAFVNGKRIVITHGHFTETQEEKSEMAARCKADIFISGHTHVSLLQRIGGTIFLNPGSPALSKREDGRSTVALMDEKQISVRDLYTGEILDSLSLE